jgi:hypothetical protein
MMAAAAEDEDAVAVAEEGKDVTAARGGTTMMAEAADNKDAAAVADEDDDGDGAAEER